MRLDPAVLNSIVSGFDKIVWWHDVSMWLYASGIFFGLLGLGLLVWWAFYVKFRKTTRIYYFISFIFFGVLPSLGFGLCIRCAKHFDMDLYIALVNSWYFGYHLLPIVVGLAFFDAGLLYQLINSWRVLTGRKILYDPDGNPVIVQELRRSTDL